MDATRVLRQQQPGATILVAENDPGLLKALAMCLRFAGHRVVSSTSGDEALEQWKQGSQNVDVLVTDLHFCEGMSGKDLAAEAQRQKPGLKVIYLAGAAVELLGASHRAGNCLPMPFRISALREMLSRLLAEPETESPGRSPSFA